MTEQIKQIAVDFHRGNSKVVKLIIISKERLNDAIWRRKSDPFDLRRLKIWHVERCLKNTRLIVMYDVSKLSREH